MRFAELDVPDEVQEGIRAAGFTIATPIQEAALPVALRGKDVAGQAQTGTGKTAAFLIAIFTRLLRHAPAAPRAGAPRALIIAPTRELVVQIESDARRSAASPAFDGPRCSAGWTTSSSATPSAAGFDLLIGTPGRLIDYEAAGVVTCRSVEVLVIDEADRMFDMGFIARPPVDPPRAAALRRAADLAVLGDPVVRVLGARLRAHEQRRRRSTVDAGAGDGRAASSRCCTTSRRDEKFRAAAGPARGARAASRILIFVNTRDEARAPARTGSTRNGYPARALAGNVDQERRLKILSDFKDGSCRSSSRPTSRRAASTSRA